jgi:hypothetical protein
MRMSRESSTANPAGSPRVRRVAPENSYKREDHVRDPKKAAKKRGRHSQRDQEKR